MPVPGISSASTAAINHRTAGQHQALPNSATGTVANLMRRARKTFFSMLASTGKRLNPARMHYNTGKSENTQPGRLVKSQSNAEVLSEKKTQNQFIKEKLSFAQFNIAQQDFMSSFDGDGLVRNRFSSSGDSLAINEKFMEEEVKTIGDDLDAFLKESECWLKGELTPSIKQALIKQILRGLEGFHGRLKEAGETYIAQKIEDKEIKRQMLELQSNLTEATNNYTMELSDLGNDEFILTEGM
ncbi:hypothetical protein [Microbulbifer sp. JMSA003]|uniref:hypothetical protein n=1 Tax=unclassified Microbulbifer TaxID=2619833 RepID=UPI004039F878